MVTDEEIERIEKSLPPVFPLTEKKVIWQSSWHNSILDCAWWDCDDHPDDWHAVPIRIRVGDQIGYVFEIRRPRPDGAPGEEWSPMEERERSQVIQTLVADRLRQLSAKPELDA